MRYLRVFLLGRFVVGCCSAEVLYLGNVVVVAGGGGGGGVPD